MGHPPLEIERSYLLSRLPELPPGTEQIQIEQGYLPNPPPDSAGEGQEIVEGRIRRSTKDGAVHCTHTIKKGEGLVRTEVERQISEEEFLREWPRTQGCRIRKVRHKVPVGERVWEVDAFLDAELYLAEIELEDPSEQVTLPVWLAPCVVRDVTEESAYRNYNLAQSLGAEGL